jgi:hypothetical protein
MCVRVCMCVHASLFVYVFERLWSRSGISHFVFTVGQNRMAGLPVEGAEVPLIHHNCGSEWLMDLPSFLSHYSVASSASLLLPLSFSLPSAPGWDPQPVPWPLLWKKCVFTCMPGCVCVCLPVYMSMCVCLHACLSMCVYMCVITHPTAECAEASQ